MSDLTGPTEDELRSRAITLLKKKRDFRGHLLIYLLFNSAVVMIWAITNRDAFFWPIFLIVFWGIGLVMNAWDVYASRDFTEDRIDQEMRRLQRH